jgi:methyltransferase (TIGR00027 family)
VSKGIFRYVIIGAGFDSFCLRRPNFSADLRIYEVDHPVTQRIKRKRLKEILKSSPKDVELLAIDLEKQTISDALSGSSFLKDERAFFSWLGTIPYLSEDAVFAILRDLSYFAAHKSEIVFDYLIPTYNMTLEDRQALGKGMRIIERWGEPVKSCFDPDTFPDEVSHLGYRIFENQSPEEVNKRYFSDRSDNLMVHSAAFIAHAEIIKK